MSVEMKKIGELFKSKREEMNLSLREVENATSIRKNYLEAIEEGHIDKLLSSVYAIGFVKQYASFLGFDGEKIIESNPKIFKLPKEKQEFDYGIGTLEQRGAPSSGLKSMPNAFWIGLSIASLILAWFLIKHFHLF